MSPSPLSLSVVTFVLLCGHRVFAQESTFPATPLVSKHYAAPSDLPYQVDTDTNLVRGTQFGYNRCNSSTLGQNSDCQTAYVNDLSDFCLWAPPVPNSDVADTEGEMVAWCTQPKYGTRLIPAGALTGVQFMRTPDYVQVVGFVQQGMIDLIDGQPGGELDPHGADLRGNPLGGIVWSNAWTNGSSFTQVIEWHNFIGENSFCFKVCDPSKPNAANFCQHIYDRIGCEYNAPNNAQNGTFESCDGDDQDFPGIYTGSNGVVSTYTQPPESLGPITSIPFTARTPASSNCVPTDSAALYAALASVTGPAVSGSGSSVSGSLPTSGVSHTTTGTTSPTASAAKPSGSNSAETLAISGTASFLGIIFAAMFFS